jgi:antitoxin YefM
MRPSQDVQAVSAWGAEAKRAVQRVRDSRRPLVLVEKGRAQAVVLDVHQYEALQEAAALARLVSEGEEDIRRGRSLTTRQVAQRVAARARR